MGSNLQNKLWPYEAPPPEGLWASLSTALDEQLPPAVSEKLHNYSAPLPSGTWEKIRHQLEEADEPAEEAAPVVPFFRRYRMPLKYTGVAAIIIFLAVLVSLTISKKSVSETTSVTAAKPQQQPSSDHPSIRLHTNTAPANASIASLSSPRKITLPPSAFKKPLSVSPLPFTSSRNRFTLFTPPTASFASMVVDDEDGRVDNYMVYCDEDGHAVRLPKKMFDAVACPNHTAACHDRLKRMQEKAAAAALNPGFGGVLDLVKHLSENQ